MKVGIITLESVHCNRSCEIHKMILLSRQSYYDIPTDVISAQRIDYHKFMDCTFHDEFGIVLGFI